MPAMPIAPSANEQLDVRPSVDGSSCCLAKQFLFIIGAPRSGTTWLQSMLGAHPSVCTTVELTLFTQYAGTWLRAWRNEAAHISNGDWHQGLPAVWSETEFHAFLQLFLDRVYSKVLELKPTATHILDKHPGYSGCTDDIRLLLPHARFIHVIRDGRDVAASLVAAQRDMGFGCHSIAEGATTWKSHVVAARSASKFRGDYLEVRYEDFLECPQRSLRSLFDFSQLDADDALVAKIVDDCTFARMKATRQSANANIKEPTAHFRKGRSGTWKDDFRLIDRYAFHRISGQMLTENGYANDDWWGNTPAHRLSIRMLWTAAKAWERIRRLLVR